MLPMAPLHPSYTSVMMPVVLLHIYFLNIYLFKKTFFFFDVHHFKVFTEFVTALPLWFTFQFFGLEACGILVPQTGIKLTLPTLEGKVFHC